MNCDRGAIFTTGMLGKLADKFSGGYQNAHPFPHVVLDDVVPRNTMDKVIEEFPGPNDVEWTDKTHQYSNKATCNKLVSMGPTIKALFFEMNSGPFVTFLETLTGIDGIVPDPHLEGGGMHQIRKGGFLEVHADFNYHKRLKLQRRLNLLLYLNTDWPDGYGGHLELWSPDLARCEKRIRPDVNRMVIFNTTDHSYHGHPEPVNCPANRTRNSLALYYYSKDRPTHEGSESHSTLYRGDAVARESPVKRRVKRMIRILAGRK